MTIATKQSICAAVREHLDSGDDLSAAVERVASAFGLAPETVESVHGELDEREPDDL